MGARVTASVRMMGSLGRDALHGLRSGRGTTLLAFGILTLTMGAATVIFSVVDAVAIQPLPYASPERLVGISLPTVRPGRGMPATPKDYFDWREGTRAFEAVAAARPSPALDVEIDGVVQTLTAWRGSANLFDVLGVRPALGRFFHSEHEQPGGPAVMILSHHTWVARFGSDPHVIGRQVGAGADALTIIGVLPAGVSYPILLSGPRDAYVPYIVTAADRANDRGTSMWVVGRLRAGVGVEQARADVERVGSALVLPLHDQVVGPAKTSMLLVLAAVGIVLLVACANVANLLLARATTRVRELATREALGASRRRLALGLLLEGLILALASAAAAVVLSFWGVGIATANLPPGLARVSEIAVDGRVLAASIGAAVLCAIVFSIAPAWLTARSDLLSFMKAGGGPVIGGHRGSRSLAAFLMADVAFVSVLLVATGLVVTSFIIITTTDLGFDRRNVMSLWYVRNINGVPEPDRPAAEASIRAELIARAKAVPGVVAAAITSGGAPLSGGRGGARLIVPGFGRTSGDDVDSRLVTPEYFHVMRMQLMRGRLFGTADVAGAPPVMVITDAAARRFFPNRDPIGQVVTYPFPPPGPTTIVGVVKGGHNDGPEAEVRPEVYTLLNQYPYHDLSLARYGGAITVGGLLVRASRDARALAPAVREAIRPVLGGEPTQTNFVEDYFDRLTAGRRFNAALMATFGMIAVVIGAIGVYGTMAFLVGRQVRAIGLRMALGATPADVRRSVLRNALFRVALGAAIGLTGAWAVSQAFTAFVFGIRPTEPVVYAGVGVFLAVVGLVAALVPARRAARLDPITALRQE